MRVRLNDAAYIRRLKASLLAAGCLAEQVEPGTIRVIHPDAVDDAEAHVELEFFVRAWQLDHPRVVAEFLP